MIKKVDVLVGCQYGSEGKGLVASRINHWFKAKGLTPKSSKDTGYDLLISVNSSQAGHTTHRYVNGKPEFHVTRQLPASAVSNTEATIFLAPSAVINLDVLFNEIDSLESAGIPISNRLVLSSVATIIEHEDETYEKEKNMFNFNGSTMEGVGASLARRALRTGGIISDYYETIQIKYPDIRFVENTNYLYDDYKYALLEGSQGFGLGINYMHYPKCTSRDTTTAGALAGAQLPFRLVDRVYGVFRTYPIRVAGNSGHLRGELTWEELSNMSGYESLSEITTVTKRVRRVGSWDYQLASDAMFVNNVTHPILTFVNYLGKENEGKETYPSLSTTARDWIEHSGIRWFALSTSKYGGWIESGIEV
jgi:adenylosuccinate synthase